MGVQFVFSNNAQTTLAGSITNIATTANLAPGSGALFPPLQDGEQFTLTFTDAATGLLNEIVYVTDISGDTITMVRAQEGTSALAWNAGDLAALLVTEGALASMLQLAGIYIADTGAANAYVIAPAAVATSYKKSDTYNIVPLHANTGASTLAVSGLAAKPIVRNDGSALQANDIPLGGMIQVVYQDTIGKFVLMNPNITSIGSAAIQTQAGNYAADTGAANAYVVTLNPAPAAYGAGLVVRFKAGNSNTGASTININALGAKNLLGADGNALTDGVILVGQTYEAIYNGTAFNLQTFTPAVRSMGSSGYCRIPGSPFTCSWTTFSIASLPQNSNTISGTIWNQQAVTLPFSFPNQAVWMYPSMEISANGQCIFAACQGIGTNGCTVYVTATAAADLPITGLLIAFGY